jgi:hypothetical protein
MHTICKQPKQGAVDFVDLVPQIIQRRHRTSFRPALQGRTTTRPSHSAFHYNAFFVQNPAPKEKNKKATLQMAALAPDGAQRRQKKATLQIAAFEGWKNEEEKG